MRTLGAILAGGASRRFGSDKATALIDGVPMLDHVITQLRPQVEDIVICGRAWDDLPSLPDRPRADMGPLGGLAAALRHAATHGFDAVLTTGCDLPELPDDLIGLLSPAPAVVKGQPLLGLWDCGLTTALDQHLATTDDLSMAVWISIAGARRVDAGRAVANINTRDDLDAFARRRIP